MSVAIGRAAVALAVTVVLVAGCGSGSDGAVSPEPDGLLRPGAEFGEMSLTIADESDDEIFDLSCDPIIVRPGTHARTCAFRYVPRLMIGYGNLARSAELLEREWQAQWWQLYLDGQEVDLAAFGTLPDRHYFDADVGDEVWLRLWAVTVVNPTPGQHTLRYVRSPVGDRSTEALDATWTFTVIPKLQPR